MSLSLPELESFVERLAETPELWRHLVRHRSHARVYERVWDAENLNAWVICWGEDQDTGFHDHDDSPAAILVIEGHIREQRLRLGANREERVIGPGERFFVPPTAIHRVLHAGRVPAVTLHAYSPPLRRTGAYRIAPDGAVERSVQSNEQELRAHPALS